MFHTPLSDPASMVAQQSQQRLIVDALKTMMEFHTAQLTLCKNLENIADNLPIAVNVQQMLSLARQIAPLIKRAHRFEEETIFNLLKEQTEVCTSEVEESLHRLQFEHWEDEAYAEELCDALLSYGKQPNLAEAEKLAYMLRGFFDNLRRHIAFEKEHIAPLLMGRMQIGVIQ